MVDASADYQRRVLEEKKFMEGVASFSALPPIVGWWSERYLKPRMREVFGIEAPNQFYVLPIERLAAAARKVEIASLGSGDGELEISLAKDLAKRGTKNYRIVGTELSPELVRRSTEDAAKAGVSEWVEFRAMDFNSGAAGARWDIVIANQVLHHVVELEKVLDGVLELLRPGGLFLTRDMIGRNGHQAWPEARDIIDQLWRAMPERYKYHWGLKKAFPEFPNFDFSNAGFEGIRAQDILPLLLERFSFSHMYAFGGVVERFINRGFGRNYDLTNEDDKAFVTAVQVINDVVLDTGFVKPTQIAAYMVKGEATCECWKGRSPKFCLRDPTA